MSYYWQPIGTAPENVVVRTKIHDQDGERNDQPLKRIGRLWFYPDSSMYVYYTPTHWTLLTTAEDRMAPEAKPLTMSAEQEQRCRKMAKAQMYGPGDRLLAELDAERAAFALLQSQFDNLRRDKEQGDRQNALILADYRKEVGAHAETRYRLRELMLHADTCREGGSAKQDRRTE